MSENVCRIKDGNTNSYLEEQRIIEDVLKYVEPHYNRVLQKIRDRDIDNDVVFVIAAFISYLQTCSPAAMRINSVIFEELVKSEIEISEKQERLPKPPEVLGFNSASEGIETGKLLVDVDKLYPQALGVTNIFQRTNTYGNSYWDFLINEDKDSPFFTSDFPIGHEKNNPKTMIATKVVPLSPDIAVRITPNLKYADRAEDIDFNFPDFRYRFSKIFGDKVRKINQIIVRSAEYLVFYKKNYDWVIPFIKKNAEYWVENVPSKLKTEDGVYIYNSTQLRKRPQ